MIGFLNDPSVRSVLADAVRNALVGMVAWAIVGMAWATWRERRGTR